MRPVITAQQASFFTRNGYIEFADFVPDSVQLFHAVDAVMDLRLQHNAIDPVFCYAQGRDVWRSDAVLQQFLLKRLLPIAALLLHKSLRLACDQWVSACSIWKKSCAMKGLFSIQNLAVCAIFAKDVPLLAHQDTLGLFPAPKKESSVLLVKPNVLLNWPLLTESVAMDLYIVAMALPNAVYVYNPNDPATHALKDMGYHFGDVLKNAYHPLHIIT